MRILDAQRGAHLKKCSGTFFKVGNPTRDTFAQQGRENSQELDTIFQSKVSLSMSIDTSMKHHTLASVRAVLGLQHDLLWPSSVVKINLQAPVRSCTVLYVLVGSWRLLFRTQPYAFFSHSGRVRQVLELPLSFHTSSSLHTYTFDALRQS